MSLLSSDVSINALVLWSHLRDAYGGDMRTTGQKKTQRGESTARMKWSQGETNKFKAALARYGPDSNIKLAAEIRTRTAAQVNGFKCRFLKAYPSWLKDNYHPASPVANVPSSRRPSPSQHSLSSQESSDHPPPRPSITEACRTGTRAKSVAAKLQDRHKRCPLPPLRHHLHHHQLEHWLDRS